MNKPDFGRKSPDIRSTGENYRKVSKFFKVAGENTGLMVKR